MGQQGAAARAALVNLIDAFNRLTARPRSVSATTCSASAYEYLLKQFADESGKKAGEFFTPRAGGPTSSSASSTRSPSETVYDPACGSGGMLVETINAVREHGGDPRTLRLYGQEVNLTTAAIARMNLFLHDIEDFEIVRGDTLRDPKFRDARGSLPTVRRRHRQSAVQPQELGSRHLGRRPALPSAACRRPRTATSPGSSTWSPR